MDNITIGKSVSIRSKGLDEYWLQDQIANNPAVLNLGELEMVAKEKSQSHGGRLDILLKEPTENIMYEVEVMLGVTDESHIIRTIEYWDREKRKYPQRQHFAVLVAETINARFFNVIHLFSHAIPIIAIQAKLVETNNSGVVLHFSTILNTYEEPEDNEMVVQEEWDEPKWRAYAPSNLETAKALFELVKPVFPEGKLHYVKNYISIVVNGYSYYSFRARTGEKSKIEIWVSDSNFAAANELFDSAEISISHKPGSSSGQRVVFTADSKKIKSHPDVIVKLAALVKDSWEKD